MNRRLVRWLAGLGLLSSAFLAGGSTGFAATETSVDCGAGADLQGAIDVAPKGAILDISGTCHGTFSVGKRLVLRGVSSAVLYGSSSGSPTVTVTASSVRMSRLVVTNGAAPGYGVRNSGTLVLSHVTVIQNGDGGIVNSGTLTLERSAVTSNGVDDGFEFGLGNSGTATITQSTISGNSGTGIGNGGTLRLVASTVSTNRSALDPGGITNGGTMMITRSTIVGNSDQNGDGSSGTGGIVNHIHGTLTITASTIAGNNGDDGAGGLYNEDTATVTVAATIIADNAISGHAWDCTGTIGSGGYNLIGSKVHWFGPDCDVDAQATDQIGGATPIDALLKPLGSYGGPTQTMKPLASSPAVDAIPIGALATDGTTQLCPASGSTDQRSRPRPDGPACDIGSVER
jgi:fibronectin-binding autotransporter adhesin